MKLDPHIVDGIAVLVREIYIRRARLQFGQMGKLYLAERYTPGVTLDGGVKDGKRYKAVWPKMAMFFLQNKLSPEICINYSFSDSGKRLFLIRPNQIATDKMLKEYREATRNFVESLKHRFHCEQSICRAETAMLHNEQGLRGNELFRAVLLNSALELSPIFKYCLAYQSGLKKTASVFYSDAVHQYTLMRDVYDEVMAGWIPDNLRTGADKLLDRFRKSQHGEEDR